jgi:shikimate kinase
MSENKASGRQTDNGINVSNHIFICGMMGAGKTTVGLLLADALDRPFHDLDLVIEIRSRLSIPDIFARYEEKGFRDLETKALKELIDKLAEPSVISLGGGTLVREENLSLIRQNGLLLYLAGRPEVLTARIKGSTRPLLQTGSEPDRIRDLLSEREASYLKAAVKIDTSDKTAAEVLEEALNLFRDR